MYNKLSDEKLQGLSNFGLGFPETDPSATRICILGGGFAGLFTALDFYKRYRSSHQVKNSKLQSCQIILIEQRDHFLFTPLLYELVTNELQTWEIAPSYQQLLAQTSIQFCRATVEAVNLKQRQIQLLSGAFLSYDYLVLAGGGQTNLVGCPGVDDHAYPFRTLADVDRLKERLHHLEQSDRRLIQIAIVGGGPSGVELAGKLADRLKARGRIDLVEQGEQILNGFTPASRAMARRALSSRQVQILTKARVLALDADQISLELQGQVEWRPVDLVLWTVGNRLPAWVDQLDCQHSPRGQLLTTPTLQLWDYPEVLALGDLAEIRDEGKPVPSTAQAAVQQAKCAARNLQAMLNGKRQRRFQYLHLGEMLTLGTDAAVVSSFGLTVGGDLACLTRRSVYLQRLPTFRHRRQVLWQWLIRWWLKLISGWRCQLKRTTSKRQQYSLSDTPLRTKL
ncbi:NAD(P)/FAD-dependent oxidoreductase [Leptolyngbya sp. FACHB-261]|uniref:NAD(P)/FAD-dependent oxidoreductase n=1 Tax=Leptolyngbya sp. FACHB-261 TaxID=2692806 RepID=UPI0016827FD8|nr:NAD(P)/FAD-dependent oxidoreductase [Leptolyngbya sp. FACHB-261]MBD2102746.1 NAD(P)/FAD-dependent oxidoreductase [Leptolyngbya sp. FACHB-261]